MKHRCKCRTGLRLGELLEPRYCLSAITFEPHDVFRTEANGAHSVSAADVDGDGDLDVITGSGNGIAWHENSNAAETFSEAREITAQYGTMEIVDMDGDGDVDVLSSHLEFDQENQRWESRIIWYKNVDGEGEFQAQQVVSIHTDRIDLASAADLDGDGDIDALSASEGDGKLAWYENLDGMESFGPQRIIDVRSGAQSSIQVVDLDQDGDIDIVAALRSYVLTPPLTNYLVWYENIDERRRDCSCRRLAVFPGPAWHSTPCIRGVT